MWTLYIGSHFNLLSIMAVLVQNYITIEAPVITEIQCLSVGAITNVVTFYFFRAIRAEAHGKLLSFSNKTAGG